MAETSTTGAGMAETSATGAGAAARRRADGPDGAVRATGADAMDAMDGPVRTTGADGMDGAVRATGADGMDAVDGAVRADGVGVGPYPLPWPDDPQYDADLLRDGDRRNVVDRYRYWSVEAIVADLDAVRHPFHVAIENLAHDFNIGSVVRTANAFNASSVHVVGRRRWNRRGAMVTDRYLRVAHDDDAAALATWAHGEGLVLVGVDNLPGSVPLETTALPRDCVLLFGQEGTGLSGTARTACDLTVSIAQFGSTRSINVGAAAAIAMHAWIREHVYGQRPSRGGHHPPSPSA